jgi:hypothetical protein
MDRKLAQQREEFQTSTQQLVETVLGKVTELSAARPTKEPSTLEEMSLVQLQSLKTEASKLENVDPNTIAQIDDAIVNRRVQDTIKSELGAFTNEQRATAQREQAKADALAQFPDLRNPQSDFYKAVDRHLQTLGDAYVQSNPQAVLDAAARVAVREGVKPVARTPIPTVARAGTAPKDEPKEPQITDEIRKLGKFFKKPDGTQRTDAELLKIAKRAKGYTEGDAIPDGFKKI